MLQRAPAQRQLVTVRFASCALSSVRGFERGFRFAALGDHHARDHEGNPRDGARGQPLVEERPRQDECEHGNQLRHGGSRTRRDELVRVGHGDLCAEAEHAHREEQCPTPGVGPRPVRQRGSTGDEHARDAEGAEDRRRALGGPGSPNRRHRAAPEYR